MFSKVEDWNQSRQPAKRQLKAAAKVYSKTLNLKNHSLTLSQVGCPDEGIKFLGPLSSRCAKSRI
jgi:hypothetical protein